MSRVKNRHSQSMSLEKIFHNIHWFEFSFTRKILILVFFIFHISLVCSVSDRGKYGNEFFGFWRPFAWDTSGWIARAGDFFAVYEAGHQAMLFRPVFRVQPELNFLPKSQSLMRAPYTATFRYPPLIAYSFGLVLNFLEPVASYKAWILFNELLIVIGIYLTAKRAKNSQTAFFVIIAWLAFYPIHIEYYMGQFSLFMGFLLFFTGMNLIRGRENKSVLWWGFSIFLKVYSIPFALYWFFRRKFQLPLFFIFALVLSSLFYFSIFPSDFNLFYERGISGRLFSIEKKPPIKIKGSISAKDESPALKKPPELYWGSMGVQRGVLALARLFYLKQDQGGNFLTPYWAHYVLFLTMLFPLPFMVLAARDKNKNPIVILALFSLGWFFWYFDTWEHHYTLLLPLLALLIAEEILKGYRAIIIYILLASPSLWIIFASPETNPLHPQNPVSYIIWETLYYLVKPLGVIWLFFSLWRFGMRPSSITSSR